jgi:uncharacterized protein YndB with AHSA1/START domain
MDEITVHVDAPPERVWALVTDITRMGEWSPECHRCEWTGVAHAPVVGATFRGHNKRGLVRWSTDCTVKEVDEPRHIAWDVDKSGIRWGYRFEPDGGGTKVTEYRDEWGTKPLYVRLAYRLGVMGRDPDGTIRNGMRTTLERVKAAAEREPA